MKVAKPVGGPGRDIAANLSSIVVSMKGGVFGPVHLPGIPPACIFSGMEKKPSSANQAAMTLGYQLLSAMIICVGGGYWLDMKRGGGHLWTLIGIGFAFVFGGYEVWKLVRQLNNEDAQEKNRDLNGKHE